jgi:type II secretory pathway component HofQ
MKVWCEKTLFETFFTGAQKYLAKRKLDSAAFIKAHSGIANRPKRVQQMNSELQLADSLAQISRANKAEQALKKPLLLRILRSAARRLP